MNKNRDKLYVKKMHVELYMLDQTNLNLQNDIIIRYIDQCIKGRERVPSVNAIIPFSLGMSHGLIRIVKKKPLRAARFPPATDPNKYLEVEVKEGCVEGDSLKWRYNPQAVPSVWADKAQRDNAKLLETYLTDPSISSGKPLIFLEGEPGTGKSFIIDDVLHKLQSNFTILRPNTAALISSFVGDSAKIIRKIMLDAVSAKPCVIVLEEADSIMMSRWTDSGEGSVSTLHVEEVVSTILQGIDMLSKETDVFIIATTNLSFKDGYSVDPAIVSRIGLQLSFNTPSKDAIKHVIEELCKLNHLTVESVDQALTYIAGNKKPSYRDIHTAITRVRLMQQAGIEPPEKKAKLDEHLTYIS